jgi:adenosylcobinamide-GDP ribazoletransferase
VNGFFDAVSLLTRLRTRGGRDTARAIPWMPVVGALIGFASGVVYWAAHVFLSSLISASLAITASILLTGALHEDGLADVADAFGARVDRARAIEIMQDPHHGTYGILALLISAALRIAAVAAMAPATAVVALTVAHALARAGAIGLMARMRPAPGSTLGASYKNPKTAKATLAGILFALALGLATLGIWAFPAAAVVFASIAIAGLLAQQKLGGFTGDVLGATEQLAEVGILLLVASAGAGIPWWRA